MKHNTLKNGQALVMLISFVAIALVVITSTIVGSFLNTTASARTQEGNGALDIAESGAENAILRLLRNPFYTGETLMVGSGIATITVSGSNPTTILSTGSAGLFKKTIQVVTTRSAGRLSISSWKQL